MAFRSPIKWFPSAVFLATALLGTYYKLVFQPLVRQTAVLDKELVLLWDRLVSSNELVRACAGLSIENHHERVAELKASLVDLQTVQKLISTHIDIPHTTRSRMEEPWQLIDFQIERLQQAGALLRVAKERGVSVEPAALAGLPEYTVDLPEPRLLWPRLDMAVQLVNSAIQCKVGSVKSLNQLPPVTHPGLNRDAPPLEEISMRIELVGVTDSITRFLKTIPTRGETLAQMGFTGPVTNKPVFFVDRLIVRKYAPDRPGEVQVEARVTGFVPWPPPPKSVVAR
ncbi:MAG: hypothetical protein N3G20_00950 [Verrucomicrobiae bacterium]|nr:hypothetical protein [Verrucomicrobiae bacterium]